MDDFHLQLRDLHAPAFTWAIEHREMASSPMASAIRTFWRLPPSLRQSIVLDQPPQPSINGRHFFNAFQSRTFTCTRHLARPQAPPKPFRNSTKTQPPSKTAHGRPTQPPSPLNTNRSPSKLDTVAPELDTVLLYTAPRHGSFFTASYFLGAGLIFGGYIMADTFLKERPDLPRTPWYIKAMSATPAVIMVTMGTACLLGPWKIIKSVAIATVNGSRILRFEIKRPLPSLKPDILETPAWKVALDRNVAGSAEDLKIHNVRMSNAKSFTESYFSKSKESKSGGVMGALSSFNRSLLNTWPAMKREIRRMLTRDQMAYVRIEGNGNFKLDLQDCTLLDRGKPLERAIEMDPEGRPSIANLALRVIGK